MWIIDVKAQVEQVDLLKVVDPSQNLKLIHHQHHYSLSEALFNLISDREAFELITLKSPANKLPHQVKD